MHRFNLSLALCAVVLVAACGGDGGRDIPPPNPHFGSVVSFGDSISDVGTYAVGAVKAMGGGKFTVNAPDAKLWIELISARLGQPPPCAAQTGLNGDPAHGFHVPVTSFPECTGYAQGGARVTDPVGRGNKLASDADALVGLLTVPVVTQINNHLATHGGRFKGDEIVFVMAGGNDLLTQLASVAAGGNPLDAVLEMAEAGDELAEHVDSMLAAGARYVTVVNLPDASKSPVSLMLGSELQDAINAMTRTFNTALKVGVDGNPNVLYVDAYALGREQSANPTRYGLTNITLPACDLSPEKNPLGSSLVCTKANTVAGVTDRYLFADLVHPTPYAHQLLADHIALELVRRGWLQ